MGVKDRGREERKEREGGRERTWEWRIDGGRGKEHRNETYEGAWR